MALTMVSSLPNRKQLRRYPLPDFQNTCSRNFSRNFTFSIFQACKLLRHIAQTEQLMVWTEHAETSIKGLSPQVNDMSMYM